MTRDTWRVGALVLNGAHASSRMGSASTACDRRIGPPTLTDGIQ